MATCVECEEPDSPGRIVELSYCGHRACMEFRRADCRDIHTRSCTTYCAAVGWTPVPRGSTPAPVPKAPKRPRAASRPTPACQQGSLFDLAVSA